MNQKDYKEIARIIKESYGSFYNEYYITQFANKLADYFEREDKELANIKDDVLADNDMETGKQRDFNRQQFLKECGVE